MCHLNYENGVVGTWAQFSSTSQNKAEAYRFANNGKTKDSQTNKEHRLVAQIYLNDKNSPATTIDCSDSGKIQKVTDPESKEQMDVNRFSFYPAEREVLALPFFTFMVFEKKVVPNNYFPEPTEE